MTLSFALAGIRRLALPLLALGIAGSFAGVGMTPFAAAQGTPVSDGSSTSAVADGIAISGLVSSPGVLTLADLQAMPAETVEVTTIIEEAGDVSETHMYTGVRLFDVLETVGLAGDPEDPESRVRFYLVLTAKDDYQVVVSVGEIAPDIGDAPMLLAWELDGAPLPAEHAPVQLVVPGDRYDARYIWGITSIDVRSVADEPE